MLLRGTDVLHFIALCCCMRSLPQCFSCIFHAFLQFTYAHLRIISELEVGCCSGIWKQGLHSRRVAQTAQPNVCKHIKLISSSHTLCLPYQWPLALLGEDSAEMLSIEESSSMWKNVSQVYSAWILKQTRMKSISFLETILMIHFLELLCSESSIHICLCACIAGGNSQILFFP